MISWSSRLMMIMMMIPPVISMYFPCIAFPWFKKKNNFPVFSPVSLLYFPLFSPLFHLYIHPSISPVWPIWTYLDPTFSAHSINGIEWSHFQRIGPLADSFIESRCPSDVPFSCHLFQGLSLALRSHDKIPASHWSTPPPPHPPPSGVKKKGVWGKLFFFLL